MFAPYLKTSLKYAILIVADKGKPCESMGRKASGLSYLTMGSLNSHSKGTRRSD